tara:strand:- start:901 stop:1752 length:852 start_codon:yes stop_codon:yes gene_type:complete
MAVVGEGVSHRARDPRMWQSPHSVGDDAGLAPGQPFHDLAQLDESALLWRPKHEPDLSFVPFPTHPLPPVEPWLPEQESDRDVTFTDLVSLFDVPQIARKEAVAPMESYNVLSTPWPPPARASVPPRTPSPSPPASPSESLESWPVSSSSLQDPISPKPVRCDAAGPKRSNPWSNEHTALLLELFEEYGPRYAKIATLLKPHRTVDRRNVRLRLIRLQRVGATKAPRLPWSKGEDAALLRALSEVPKDARGRTDGLAVLARSESKQRSITAIRARVRRLGYTW